MRYLHAMGFLILLFLSACQAYGTPMVAIVDGSQLRLLSTSERTPSAIIRQAGILLSPVDEVLFNGQPVELNTVLPAEGRGTLQVRRAIAISANGAAYQTTAQTVGEALAQTGTALYAADALSASPAQYLVKPLAVNHAPSHELTVAADGREIRVRTGASTVGAGLAGAGLPLLGLDRSQPTHSEQLPADGNVRLVRVSESVVLGTKPIPFQRKNVDSAEVELGHEQILQPGLNGLAVSRTRIRYEDGKEVSRQTETETVVRPPQDRVTARGTKIVLTSATINGVSIQYWYQLQMYATVYSPCNSGGSKPCSTGTASGLTAGKGVVAVDPGLYAYLNGQRLYIPGYGKAVIGDIGGGYIIEQTTGVSRYRWIDLGFDDNNIVDMTGWVTVYFLAPAPVRIPEILQ